ncbi:YjbH domain-containing protein [Thiomicrorhabdus sp. zzn3]|uniref:YjbH domain-containing protein n=1 Tax=Thiomicrorhabdus sp. zzn3 TaxID=3039775 RepID=UPI002437088F|nr:YjbH domain-containing protein [Thiomicrorhabdus sp. zzn3]MDG6777386.1 YjbH domain-containing protein [Thiomicrorhabdus sp. zzn3]
MKNLWNDKKNKQVVFLDKRHFVLGLFLILPFAKIQANDSNEISANTVYGATGLLTIPAAQTLDYGTISFGYNNFVNPEYVSLGNREAQNYLFGVGVFPGLEVYGRLAEVHRKDYDPHAWGDFDSRDLIVNFKYRLPLPESWPAFAVGIQDAAGLAVKERRYYATSTYQTPYVDVTLGYAKKGEDSCHNAMLEGLFGGVDVKLAEYARLQMEHDGFEQRAGVALKWQKPFGWDVNVSASGVLYSSLTDEEPSFSIGLQIPLMENSSSGYWVEPDNDDSVVSDLSQEERQQVEYVKPHSDYQPPSFYRQTLDATGEWLGAFSVMTSDDLRSQDENIAPVARDMLAERVQWAEDFKNRLVEHGFEYIAVGYKAKENTLTLSYENRAFAHGDLDALKALFELLAQEKALKQFERLQVLILKEKQPLIKLDTQVSWLLENAGKSPKNLPTWQQFKVTFANQFDDTGVLLAKSERSEWLDIKLSPAYRAYYGHEKGVWDYSLALRTDFQVPLWQGARASFVHELPVSHSYNYDHGEVFEDKRHESMWRQAMLYQNLHLLPGLLNATVVGRLHIYDRPYNAIINSTRLYAFDGSHQLYARVGQLYGELYGPHDYRLADREVRIFGYEYLLSRYNVALNYEYGQYYEQDITSKLTLKSYLGNSTVNLQYVNSDLGWERVGVGISVPLWAKKKVTLGPLSISGDENWTHQIATTIDNPINADANLTSANAGYVNVGVEPSGTYRLHNDWMQGGRLTPDYILKNIQLLF